MKAKDLVSGLEALCAPDAEVFFIAGDGDVLEIGGGLLDIEEETGRQGVLLTTRSQRSNGGF